jgi:hypothetical protein
VRSLNKFAWSIPALFLVLAVVIFSCKEEDNDLGLNIQPPNDKLNVFYSDTTTIVAYSQLVDSVRTDETSLSMLGSILDPVFGKTTTSFYTQCRLSQSAFTYGNNPLADSLILSLLYEKYYGDTLAPLTIKVYEMDEQIFIDSNYYSHFSIDVKPTLLAQMTFTPDYTNDVILGNDTLPPHLRVNLGQLSSELIDKLLNVPADSMAANDNFLNYFYGLYVTVEPVNSGGQIIYFDLMASLSRMTMYYHNDSDDSLFFNYTINSNCARFGHVEHDYSLAGPAFKSQVLDQDTALGDHICYVQSLAGVKTFLRFPNIKNYYSDGKIAVNEARLFLNCYETDPELAPANNLILVIKKDTTGYTITEDQLQGSEYYGGYYDSDKNGYWFRITNTVQDLMRRTDTDYGLEIYMSGGGVNAERVLLHGPRPLAPFTTDDRMKLVITYTRL